MSLKIVQTNPLIPQFAKQVQLAPKLVHGLSRNGVVGYNVLLLTQYFYDYLCSNYYCSLAAPVQRLDECHLLICSEENYLCL